MKILVLHQFYTTAKESGITRFSSLGREWIRQGNQVTVITGRVNYQTGIRIKKIGWLYTKEKDGEIEVRRAWSTSIGYRTWWGRMLAYLTFTETAIGAGIFMSRPDVIIASSPPISIGVVGWLLAVWHRRPLVFEVRDLWPDVAVELGYLKKRGGIYFMARKLENWLYSRAKIIMTNSPGIKTYLNKYKGVAENKIGVVPNPAPELVGITREEARKKLGLGEEKVILYAGSMSAVYDFEVILQTAREMKGQKEIRFVIIGDGRQKEGVLKKAKKMDLQNIYFHTAVGQRELSWWLLAADVGVASLRDINCLHYVYATKIFDYMAAGLPIVLAMQGVSCELVKEAKAGICTKEGEVEEFVRGIREVLDNKEMGEKGKKFIEEKFGREKLAKDYLEILNKVGR